MVRLFWITLALVTAAKLLFIGTTMVVDDEAHYFAWSRHLDLGYIDNGPFVAFLIRASTALFGASSFGIRALTVFLSTALAAYLFVIFRRSFGVRAAFTSGMLLSTTLLFFGSTVVTTPDSPMWLAMALAIVLYHRAFFVSPRAFYAAGFFLGISALSKISVFLPAVGVFLFPFVIREMRSFIRRADFYFSFLIAAVVVSPFVVWNFLNDFAFLRFKGPMAFQSGSLADFGAFWAAQLGLLFPPLAVLSVGLPLVIVFQRFIQRRDTPPHLVFFALTAAFPLLFFVIGSIRTRYEAYWSIAFALPGILLVAAYVGTDAKRFRRTLAVQLVGGALSIAASILQVHTTLIPLSPTADVTRRYFKFSAFPTEIRAFLASRPDLARYRVLSNNYQIPSMLITYAAPTLVPTCLSIDGYHDTFYLKLVTDSSLIGHDHLFLLEGDAFPDAFRAHFVSVEFVQSFVSRRAGATIATFSLWLVRNYRGRAAMEQPASSSVAPRESH
ncbi:MAG: glycosyltransferase family 39 protein [Deltaproteobacteria bacterium]|nr:glycosyltransferase family 39 protein [Deltaproteobacteria bacterium]